MFVRNGIRNGPSRLGATQKRGSGYHGAAGSGAPPPLCCVHPLVLQFCNGAAAVDQLGLATIRATNHLGRRVGILTDGTIMKTILRSMTMVSALALGVAGAQAADLIVAPVAVASPDTFNWTGFYAGVHGGYASGDFKSDWVFEGSGLDSYKDKVRGGFGGIQIGYNHQFASQWVAGVEADFALSSLDLHVGGSNWSTDGKLDWFGTVRGRLGYAFDNVLVYGTGGAAYGRVKMDEIWDSVAISHADTHWGWTAGAGLEVGIARNVTLKAEYLYVDLGSTGFDVNIDDALRYDVDVTFHAFKAGLNYKF
jgi:outer membrane immunogenic protein